MRPHPAAGNTLKLHYAHNLDAARTAGAEVTRPINGGDTKAVVGYSHRLQDGAVSKLRIDTGGLLTILYEQVGAAAICLSFARLLSCFDGLSEAEACTPSAYFAACWLLIRAVKAGLLGVNMGCSLYIVNNLQACPPPLCRRSGLRSEWV